MKYDVIIIGGGLVGAALASALKNSSLRIALIDAMPHGVMQDERLIALNDASVCLFENSGIWPLLVSHATPIKQIHVSQRGRFGTARIHADIIDLNALGYVVPAKFINQALSDFLKNAENINFFKPATLETLQQNDADVTISIKTVSGLHELQTSLLIGADGSYSTVRNLLDIPTEEMDYQQTALVTTTLLQRSHNNIAYERFLDEGAIAMLPLLNQKVATIWTAATSQINTLMKLEDNNFLAELQKQFGYRLGKLIGVEKRATYPLKMIKAKNQNKGNIWLIGNAAHTIHPIAAQGLNVALYEVAILASSLLENNVALRTKLTEQHFNLRLSHQLAWIFSSDIFVFNQLRQVGLMGLDLISNVKKRFAMHAIGKGGYIPTLLTRNSR